MRQLGVIRCAPGRANLIVIAEPSMGSREFLELAIPNAACRSKRRIASWRLFRASGGVCCNSVHGRAYIAMVVGDEERRVPVASSKPVARYQCLIVALTALLVYKTESVRRRCCLQRDGSASMTLHSRAATMTHVLDFLFDQTSSSTKYHLEL